MEGQALIVLRRRRAFVLAALLLGLVACQAPAPGTLPGSAPGISPPAEPLPAGPLWRVQAGESRLRVLAFRDGPLAALGHNHVLTASGLEGWLSLPGYREGDGHAAGLQRAELAGARLALWLRLDALALDEPARRAELGPAFASVPGDDAVAATRANLLGPALMDAALYPLVQASSVAVEGEGQQLSLQLALQWHGQRRLIAVSPRVRVEAGVLRVDGRMLLKQSDFGIPHFSVLGGLLSVQDMVWIDFELLLRQRP